jgi:hypothetical protein
MIVCLGALLAAAVSIFANQPRTRRVLWVISWTVSVLLLLGIVAFALDAVQARRQIRADLLASYQIASITAELKMLLGVLTFAMLGRASRQEGTIRQDSVGSPMLVGKTRIQT